MNEQTIERGDIEALAQILETEKQAHRRTRALCFALFVFCFAVLTVAICVLAFLLVTARAGIAGDSLTFLQVLTPLGAMVVGFFSFWWTAQNCINSIDRTLFAARSGRHRLFVSFLGQLQCADKKRKRLMLEVVGALVS
jgi:hypothetical protein